MISEQLFEKVLIEPVRQGADELNIISGYATASMVSRHLEELTSINPNIKIKLIIGMTIKDGIAYSNHRGFLSIQESEKFKNNFICQYIFQSPPIHSKLFIWKQKDKIHSAFLGSANYSQTAFSSRQREIMEQTNDIYVLDYFENIEKESILSTHSEIEENVKILSDKNYWKSHHVEELENTEIDIITSGIESFRVLLYSKILDEVQEKGGLNWGQRNGRNPNQAYIQLPPEVYKSDFFPKRPAQFNIITDDNKSLLCVRAQKSGYGGQAIQTTLNNAHLGEYFRMRMNHLSGAPIWKKDLENYGRLDVVFSKIDDETYLMDFSVD